MGQLANQYLGSVLDVVRYDHLRDADDPACDTTERKRDSPHICHHFVLLTPTQMNYVVVLMAAVAIFAVGYWYAAGQYYYIGPRVKAQLIMGVPGEEGKANSSGGSSDEKRDGVAVP